MHECTDVSPAPDPAPFPNLSSGFFSVRFECYELLQIFNFETFSLLKNKTYMMNSLKFKTNKSDSELNWLR